MSDTRTVSRGDFMEFGRRLGLNEKVVKRELDRFCDDYTELCELIMRSFPDFITFLRHHIAPNENQRVIKIFG